MSDQWRMGPYGLDAAMGSTLTGRRTVLVVVHHVTAATRLADIIPMLESDRRVQVVYTSCPASTLSVGVEEHLHRMGGVVIPYSQATRMQFDLAVAAGDGLLQQLHAPILMLLHGASPGTLAHRWQGHGPSGSRTVAGLHRGAIVSGGRVIPSALGIPHESHLPQIGEACPEAIPITAVVGDPALDRIVASHDLRDAYRQALGVGPGQRLVVVSSTWGPRSQLGHDDGLLFRLVSSLPPEKYRVVAAFHPAVWTWHGARQISAWFQDSQRLGVRLLPLDGGWQAALVAADRIVGDHGSVTAYGAAIGVPTLLAAFPEDDVVEGSATALLGRMAPRLDSTQDLERQIAGCTAGDAHALRARLTSRPGQAAKLIRRVMYDLMGLAEPETPALLDPIPSPRPVGTH